MSDRSAIANIPPRGSCCFAAWRLLSACLCHNRTLLFIFISIFILLDYAASRGRPIRNKHCHHHNLQCRSPAYRIYNTSWVALSRLTLHARLRTWDTCIASSWVSLIDAWDHRVYRYIWSMNHTSCVVLLKSVHTIRVKSIKSIKRGPRSTKIQRVSSSSSFSNHDTWGCILLTAPGSKKMLHTSILIRIFRHTSVYKTPHTRVVNRDIPAY